MIAKYEEHCHTTKIVGKLVEGVVGDHVGGLSSKRIVEDKRIGFAD